MGTGRGRETTQMAQLLARESRYGNGFVQTNLLRCILEENYMLVLVVACCYISLIVYYRPAKYKHLSLVPETNLPLPGHVMHYAGPFVMIVF